MDQLYLGFKTLISRNILPANLNYNEIIIILH